MNKKKLVLAFSYIILIVALLVASCFLYRKVKNTEKLLQDSVLATSDLGNVTVKDVKDYLKNLEAAFKKDFDFDKISKEDRNTIVKEIINERVIINKAKKDNIENDENYKKKLVFLSNNLIKEVYLEKLIKQTITDEKINQKYKEMAEYMKDKKEYKIKHIVVKTEDEIKKVISELKSNTFEDLAAKYSIDASKDSGGDLGYVIEGQIVKDFENVVKKQPLNKLSEPFKTKFGWHILIKEDERKAVIPDFEQSKGAIKTSLITEFIKNYSAENLKNSNIDIK